MIESSKDSRSGGMVLENIIHLVKPVPQCFMDTSNPSASSCSGAESNSSLFGRSTCSWPMSSIWLSCWRTSCPSSNPTPSSSIPGSGAWQRHRGARSCGTSHHSLYELHCPLMLRNISTGSRQSIWRWGRSRLHLLLESHTGSSVRKPENKKRWRLDCHFYFPLSSMISKSMTMWVWLWYI